MRSDPITPTEGVAIDVGGRRLPTVILSLDLWRTLGFPQMAPHRQRLWALALALAVIASAPSKRGVRLEWIRDDGVEWVLPLPLAGDTIVRRAINLAGERVIELSLPEENEDALPALQVAKICKVDLRNLRWALRDGERQEAGRG